MAMKQLSKTLFLVITIILLFCNNSSLNAQNTLAKKKIALIHGLNSSSSFWNPFFPVLGEKGYDWCAPSYNSSYPTGASGIASDIFNSYLQDGQYILIGHSAGGLIARSIKRNHSDNIKGVVTIGTPNYGAGIITSMQDASYLNILDEMVENTEIAMSSTYEAFFNIVWPFGTFVKPILDMLYYETINSFNNSIENRIYPAIKEYIDENYLQLQLVEDMDPSSAFLTNLNSSINTPLYTVAGAEDPWQLFRLMGTALNGDDLSLIKDNGAIRRVQSFIISMINIHNCVYDGSKWIALLLPQLWITRESVKSSRRNWEDLQRFLEIDIHTKWAEQIGAYHYEETVVTIPIYDTSINPGDVNNTNPGGNQGVVGEIGGIIGYKQEVRTVKKNDEHDGLVGTATALAGLASSGVKTEVIQGVNHLEMSSNTSVQNYLISVIQELSRPSIVIVPIPLND